MSKVVVITGGSKGIGKALAVIYSKNGDHVIILARDQASIDEAISEISSYRKSDSQQFLGLSTDVCDSNRVKKTFKTIYSSFKRIDILITSAGFSKPGYFENQTEEIFRDTMDVNFFGTLYPIQVVSEKMAEQGGGQICIIASGAALIGIFGTSAYCASKYALRGLADSLRSEFRLKGISLSIAYLPDTDTPLSQKVAKFKPYETQLIMGTGGFFNAQVVAKRIFIGIKKKKYSIVKGVPIRMLYLFGSLLMPILQRYFHLRIKLYRRKIKKKN